MLAPRRAKTMNSKKKASTALPSADAETQIEG
jgi:hypothetical protein